MSLILGTSTLELDAKMFSPTKVRYRRISFPADQTNYILRGVQKVLRLRKVCPQRMQLKNYESLETRSVNAVAISFFLVPADEF